MDEVTTLAARLLERGQSGEAEAVVAEAEALLRAATGDLVDGPAGLHFARAVAMRCTGDLHAALAATDLMIAAATRQSCNGWLSCALSLRADLRVELGERDVAEHDLETVLRDLLDAENALLDGVDDPWLASNAHTGIALPFHRLRLYELALPHYTAAFEVSTHSAADTGASAMWLLNLAEVELDWSLELYRVGQNDDAEKHSLEAERYAVRAAATAAGPDGDRWRDLGRLQACSARISCGEVEPALSDAQALSADLDARGMGADVVRATPFVAVALNRAGQREQAMAVLRRSLDELDERSTWLQRAALEHTLTFLLVDGGSSDAELALRYGHTLAQSLWRQRLRTLHVAETMRSIDTLRHAHDQAARSALTDPLTGIANRRAFDETVAALGTVEPRRSVAALVIDLDGFKSVNDTRGHDVGDDLLRRVAGALAGATRDGDLVARFGGDEFAALLPGADATSALTVARRMVAAVTELAGCTTTASIGVCARPAADLVEAINRADQAMYQAKRGGGGRVADADADAG